jgi:diacylglycerol kinase (ATP)
MSTIEKQAPVIALVVNPRALHGRCGAWLGDAVAALRTRASVTVVETRGDGDDVGRIGALLVEQRPAVAVAAGGDGTVRAVAQALRDGPAPRPALGLLPLGTANNAARSLGLASIRAAGSAAVGIAVAAVLAGAERPLDVGEVDGRCFVGSFAVGMDADILVSRNRWRGRWRLGRRSGGYPLYLASCTVNLARCRSTAATVRLDAVDVRRPLYNLLVCNTALYAGEFRFDDGADHSADGRLDVHAFADAAEYVRGFVTAWRRHVHHRGGRPVAAPPQLQRVERLQLELDAPRASQLDGEEHTRAARYEVRVVPAALTVRVPPAT